MVTACIDEKNYVSAGGAISYDWLVEHLIHVNHNEMPLCCIPHFGGKSNVQPVIFGRIEIAVMAKRRFRKRSLQNKENKKAKKFYRYGKKIHHSFYTIYWLNEEIQLSSP